MRDWGSEKVVNISFFVFRLKSLSQNNKPYYLLKTKRAKENTFSLLPPQAVPLFLAKTANPLSLRDISLSKGILIRGRLDVSKGFIKWQGIPRQTGHDRGVAVVNLLKFCQLIYKMNLFRTKFAHF